MVTGQAKKAKTKASQNEARIGIAIAEMQGTKTTFDAIIARAEELGKLLDQLVVRATSALDLLELSRSIPYNMRFGSGRR